ncbi:MAG: hypothetical protein J3Q66DRAFT_388707 [Benniella sp.]|nr:MAG: hypothetical protein J3Q66DRAFT_388707 [Benniella sp.]
MPFLKVYVALYDYEADTEGELTFKENDVLYILEDSDPHWWKAKLKFADSNHSHIGLVPSNYVEPLPSIGTVHGLYRYEATTQELAFEQGDTLTLYEQDDPDWFLVGNGFQVGFVPRSYVEVSPGQKGHSREHQAEGGDQSKGPSLQSDTPTMRTHGNKDSTKIWTVDIDEKKKKRKGRLGLYNTLIVFGSDVDKSPVRKWLTKDVNNIRQEKCHVYLDLGGVSPASLNFKSSSKQEAEDIFNEIQKSRTLCPVTSPTLTSLVCRSMSVPTCQTAQGPPNASAARISHHKPGKDVLAAPSPTSVPIPSHARPASRTIRVMNRTGELTTHAIWSSIMIPASYQAYRGRSEVHGQ